MDYRQLAAAPNPLRGPSVFAADPMLEPSAQRFTCTSCRNALPERS